MLFRSAVLSMTVEKQMWEARKREDSHMCMCAQSRPALCNPMDCSPPGSSVHGISQAEILEGVPFPFPGDLPHPGFEPRSPALQQTLYHLGHQGSHTDRYMDGKLYIKTR